MPLYESVVIARQDIATTQVDTLADELTAILGEGGGKVTKRESWGLRSLTYRIKKNRKAHYLFFNIDDYERLGSLVQMNPSATRPASLAADAPAPAM